MTRAPLPPLVNSRPRDDDFFAGLAAMSTRLMANTTPAGYAAALAALDSTDPHTLLAAVLAAVDADDRVAVCVAAVGCGMSVDDVANIATQVSP